MTLGTPLRSIAVLFLKVILGIVTMKTPLAAGLAAPAGAMAPIGAVFDIGAGAGAAARRSLLMASEPAVERRLVWDTSHKNHV